MPLLEPIALDPSPLVTVDERVQARELLLVGYFSQAQQVVTNEERQRLLERARAVSLELLREKPDHALDAMVFPVSVVDLFEEVRRENSEELNKLIAERENRGQLGTTQTVYLERTVTANTGWVNFLPFAVGQFQNGHLVKGTLFATLQAAGLIVNGLSYWTILRLRNPQTGQFATEDDLSSDFAKAQRWRQALYGGLAGFAAAWAVSVIDAWVNYEPETVRIRTLDAPPPELGGSSAAGLGFDLQLGLSVELRW